MTTSTPGSAAATRSHAASLGRVDRHAALAGVVHVVPVAATPPQHVAGDVLDPDDGGAQLGEVGTGERRRLVAEVEHDDVLQQPHRADVMRADRVLEERADLARWGWPRSATA